MTAKKPAPAKKKPKAQPAPVKRGRGHPTDYRPDFCEQARQQCVEGATDQELADFFKVSVRTLYRWKNTFPDFCQALKASKEQADERVERSLYERALGYERDELDIRVIDSTIVQTTVRKFYPPDTTAAIFWLKNRRSATWRDKVDHEHTGANGGAIQLVLVDATDLKAAVRGAA